MSLPALPVIGRKAGLPTIEQAIRLTWPRRQADRASRDFAPDGQHKHAAAKQLAEREAFLRELFRMRRAAKASSRSEQSSVTS